MGVCNLHFEICNFEICPLPVLVPGPLAHRHFTHHICNLQFEMYPCHKAAGHKGLRYTPCHSPLILCPRWHGHPLRRAQGRLCHDLPRARSPCRTSRIFLLTCTKIYDRLPLSSRITMPYPAQPEPRKRVESEAGSADRCPSGPRPDGTSQQRPYSRLPTPYSLPPTPSRRALRASAATR